MANPPHLFRPDWRLDEQVPHIRPWLVGVVDKIGSEPPSSYFEDFCLGILGAPRSLHAVGERGVSA
jgi:hypothetical protein